MLRLPVFDVVTPTTIDEAVVALAQPGARVLAGGTDLLPNLKHVLDTPSRLVSLAQVEGLRHVRVEDGVLAIGAGMTLSEVAASVDVGRHAPSLADAAGRVASPLIRNMATLGGNVNLDTRCRYVNQTKFWRSAIGGCLKSEGDVCHVVPKGRNCVAAMSSDCVPVLISLGGSVVLRGPNGRREVQLAEYFHADGVAHTVRAADELTTEIRVPVVAGVRRAAYRKWSVRGSIDFPLVSLALRVDLDRDDDRAKITGLSVVVGVLGAKPRVLGKLDGLIGRPLADSALAGELEDAVYRQCKPLENVPYEAAYRRKMLRVVSRRALRSVVRG